jgi:hypothetical protein
MLPVCFVEGAENRVVKKGWAQFDGVKVELCFENLA